MSTACVARMRLSWFTRANRSTPFLKLNAACSMTGIRTDSELLRQSEAGPLVDRKLCTMRRAAPLIAHSEQARAPGGSDQLVSNEASLRARRWGELGGERRFQAPRPGHLRKHIGLALAARHQVHVVRRPSKLHFADSPIA